MRRVWGEECGCKLHLLEAHLWYELAKHERLGLFGEDPIERQRHQNKIYNLLFVSIKQWSKKQQHKPNVESTQRIPEVNQAQEREDKFLKRKFAATTTLVKENKKQSVRGVKNDKYAEVIRNAEEGL